MPHPPSTPSRATDDAREMALVRAIQGGDAGAWSELLSRYQDRLFGVCFRMVHNRDLAADLTQDAMVKIIEGLGSYDGRAKLSTWMIRVTMNVCLSRLRSERLRRHASLDGRPGRGRETEHIPHKQGREQAAEEHVEREELRETLVEALLRIPPEQRAILVLRDSRGLDYEQIGHVLGVPVGTVKSRLFRARGALREAMESREAPSLSEPDAMDQ